MRWRPAEGHFEVLGHGQLWFDDTGGLIGAADVAEAASLTELRNALERHRRLDGTMVEFMLSVFDVDEDLLMEEEGSVSPRPIGLELTERHTFIVLTMAVEPEIRFNQHELAAILWPQLTRHRAVVMELAQDPLPLMNLTHLTVKIEPRGRTVGDALTVGDDLYALWMASLGGSLNPETVADLVRAQRPQLLTGQPESVWLEAKGGAYDLSSTLSQLELGKDVAALANRADGGILLIGLTTGKTQGVDTIKKVVPLSKRDLRPSRYQQVIDKVVFPRPQDLVIEFVEVEPDHGVMLILVPAQPEVLFPFLVIGAIREGKLLGNHFSLVRRRGDATGVSQAEAVHGLLVAGRAALATSANVGFSEHSRTPEVDEN